MDDLLMVYRYSYIKQVSFFQIQKFQKLKYIFLFLLHQYIHLILEYLYYIRYFFLFCRFRLIYKVYLHYSSIVQILEAVGIRSGLFLSSSRAFHWFETTKDVIPKLICPCSFAQDNNSIISLCFSGLCPIWVA